MKKLLLIILSLFLIKLNAQRLAGSEIYYERISNRLYLITAVVYRECDSDPLTSLNAFVFADSLAKAISLNRVSIEKINDTCGNPCNISNGIGNAGFEKHTYSGTINFNQTTYSGFLSNSRCRVTVGIRQGGRDSRTTTHGTGMYYNEATINICDSTLSNRSPRFSMEPKFHIALNQPLSYSPGPIDPMDGDSLVFSIEPVLADSNTSIAYYSNYSHAIPLTPYCPPNPGQTSCKALTNAKPPRGFFFDKEYCTMILTPTKRDEMGYVRIKIREYRKISNQWVELGSVSRDFLVSTKSVSDNNPPYFVTEPSINSTITLCSKSYSINFTAKDEPFLPKQTWFDSTYIIYDHGLNRSKFETSKILREQEATLTLYGDSTASKVYYFTIANYDKKCNISTNTRTYKVVSSPIIEYVKSYTIDSCTRLSAKIKLKDSTMSIGSSFDLTQPDDTKVSFNTNTDLDQNGTYSLIYKANNGLCTAYQYDTFAVTNAFIKPTLNITKDSSVCLGAPLNFKFIPSTVKDLNTWNWYINDTLVNTTDSFMLDTFRHPSEYKLTLYDKKGCTSERVLSLSTYNWKNYQLFSPMNLANCPGITTNFYINQVALKSPLTSKWSYDGKDSINNANMLTVSYPDEYQTQLLRVVVKDDNHCEYKDSIYLSALASPKFEITSDRPICKDSLVILKLERQNSQPINLLEWAFYSVGSGLYMKTKDSLEYRKTFRSPEYVVAKLIDNMGCEHTDTFYSNPVQTPSIRLEPINAVCEGNSIQIVATAMNSGPYSYKWKQNGQVLTDTGKTLTLKEKAGQGTVYLQVDNAGQCFDQDSINYRFNPLPDVQIIGDTLYSVKDVVKLRSLNKHQTYYWSNSTNVDSFSQLANAFGPAGKYQVWLRVTNEFFCQAMDTVTIYTDKQVGIDDLMTTKTVIYPNPANEILNIVVHEAASFRILNLEGKCLMESKLMEGLNHLHVETLSGGVYIIEINGQYHKFIKS